MFPAQLPISPPLSAATGPERGPASQPITAPSPQSVLLHVLRAVGEPSWAPAPAAKHLLEHVDDALVLRRSRALLRVVTRHRIDPSHARAFATITMALNRLEDHRAAPSPAALVRGAYEVQP